MTEHLSSLSGSGESDATSLSLIARLRADDAAAWQRLAHLYAPLLRYWCQRCGLAAQDAGDILQEVFQAVALNIRGFQRERPGDSFRAWLRAITRNKIRDHYRRLAHEPQPTGGTEANLRLAELPADEEEDLEDEDGERSAYQELVERALELIRPEFMPRSWQAFWRVTVDGRSPADVAGELGMQPGAVRVAKSRVLRRLREELGELA